MKLAAKGTESKYKNKKTVYDEIVFDSQKEAIVYMSLKSQVRTGLIKDLRLQVPYELNEGGTHSVKYIADFVYEYEGETVVCDVKGFRTREYKRKRRLMKKVLGIVIKEL